MPLSTAPLFSPFCAFLPKLLLVHTHTRACAQALVVVSGYKYSIQVDWVDPLFKHVVVAGDFRYLSDYKKVFPLTAQLLEDLVKRCVGCLLTCLTSIVVVYTLPFLNLISFNSI